MRHVRNVGFTGYFARATTAGQNQQRWLPKGASQSTAPKQSSSAFCILAPGGPDGAAPAAAPHAHVSHGRARDRRPPLWSRVPLHMSSSSASLVSHETPVVRTRQQTTAQYHKPEPLIKKRARASCPSPLTIRLCR